MRDHPRPGLGLTRRARSLPPRVLSVLTSTKQTSKNRRMKSSKGAGKAPMSAAARQARSAWQTQYRDSHRSLELAEQVCARVQTSPDITAEGWARLTRGLHMLRLGSRADAKSDLARAQDCF